MHSSAQHHFQEAQVLIFDHWEYSTKNRLHHTDSNYYAELLCGRKDGRGRRNGVPPGDKDDQANSMETGGKY